MEQHDKLGKVVPPSPVLEERFQQGTRQVVHDRMLADLVREAKLEQRVDKVVASVKAPSNLVIQVKADLTKKPFESWEKPLSRITTTYAEKALSTGSKKP